MKRLMNSVAMLSAILLPGPALAQPAQLDVEYKTSTTLLIPNTGITRTTVVIRAADGKFYVCAVELGHPGWRDLGCERIGR
jgi:hypothetical protein